MQMTKVQKRATKRLIKQARMGAKKSSQKDTWNHGMCLLILPYYLIPD